MKVASLLLLPLLASGAVIRSPSEEEDLNQQNSPEMEPLKYDIITKRQTKQPELWDLVGNYFAPSLPGLLQWGVDNLSYILRWQSAPVKKDRLPPTFDPKAKKVVIRYGPYILRGTQEVAPSTVINMDDKGSIIIRTLRGLPEDAAILTAKTGLVYADDSPATFANGVYVHHILIADMNKPTAPFAMCPETHKESAWLDWAAGYVVEAVGAGLVQTGNDAVHDPNFYGTKKGDMKSAFLTGLNDMFLMQAEIVNYNPTNRSVFLTLELEYLDERPKSYIDSSTVILSATGCGSPGYRPPVGATMYNHTSKDFKIKQNGWVVNARGHLHDGGTSIQLWHNDKMVCDSTPTYGLPPGAKPGSGETILDMSWCYDPVKLTKGDSLVVKTFYDTKLHPMREDPAAAGAAHGGHGGTAGVGGAAAGAPAGSSHGSGMEGMEEMGIMTTNFAWEGGSAGTYSAPTKVLNQDAEPVAEPAA